MSCRVDSPWGRASRAANRFVSPGVLAAFVLVGCGPSAPEVAEIRVPEVHSMSGVNASSDPEPPPDPGQPEVEQRRRPGDEEREPAEKDATDFAKQRFQEGVEAYQSGDFQTACFKFQEAYDRVQNQALLFNIASCQLKMGDKARACETFRRYVLNGDPADPRIQEVTKQVAAKCP